MASALTAIGEEDGQTQFGNALMNAARDAMAVFKATGQEHLKNIKQRET